MSSNKLYDYVIIGGGIAGLHSLYKLYKLTKLTKLSKLNRNLKVLLIEKEDHLGGRAQEVKFHGELIKLGAGIAATDNKKLLPLLRKLNVRTVRVRGYKNVIGIKDTSYNHNLTIKKLINKYKSLVKSNTKFRNLTVRKFLKKYLKTNEYINFLKYMEYGDYLDGDVEYYIKRYPIKDDDINPYIAIFLSWTELANKLIKNINKSKIKLNTKCNFITKNNEDNTFIINVNDNKKIYTRNIISTVTVNVLTKITSKLDILDYNKYVGSVPFMRIYTYHKNGHNFQNDNIGHFNIILNQKNHLQKVLVMNDKILMATYSNNEHALYWHNIKSKRELINKLEEYLRQINVNVTDIDDIYVKFWDEGVHYFKPIIGFTIKELIKKLENPIDNFYVCGEIISLRQGWVEGAIESSTRVMNRISRLLI
jgi:protoporphyrinogen oxidase